MPDQPWAIRDTSAGVVIDLAQPRMKIDRRERELAPADETQLANSAAPKGSPSVTGDSSPLTPPQHR
jgi:hypothetical protein